MNDIMRLLAAFEPVVISAVEVKAKDALTTRLQTSFMYPGNEYVDIYIEDCEHHYLLSDEGGTLETLLSWCRDPDQRQDAERAINQACTELDVARSDGSYTTLVAKSEVLRRGDVALKEAVMRLGQACVRIACTGYIK